MHPRFTKTALDSWIIFDVTWKTILQKMLQMSSSLFTAEEVISLRCCRRHYFPLFSRNLTSFCNLPLPCSLAALQFSFFFIFLLFSFLFLFRALSSSILFRFPPSSLLPFLSFSFVFLPTDALF